MSDAFDALLSRPIDRDFTPDEAARALAELERATRTDPTRTELDTALDRTAHPRFLEALDASQRAQWSQWALTTIRGRNHRLDDLLRWRAVERPDHPLFADRGDLDTTGWSYAAVRRRVRSLAAALWGVDTPAGRAPRIVLWTANGIEGACADLACLTGDLFAIPLGVHLSNEELGWI